MRILKRPFDLLLAATFVLSVMTILLANEDSFFRATLCERTGFCPSIAHAKAWEKIAYDLAVAYLVSLLFYALVVRLPEYERRQRFKKSLERHYQSFREDCIEIMLLVADGTFTWGFQRTLMEQNKFRDYFKENVGQGQDRWNAFQNKLDKYYLQQLITKLEVLRDEINFVLNNVDIPSDEPFEFMKRLSAAIVAMKKTTDGYDDKDRFTGFLWSVFAGWSNVTGYSKSDVIKDMIKAI